MKQAIYIHTNAYDMILLPNGTWIDVENVVLRDFLSASADDFDNWNGLNRWDDLAETMEEAAGIITDDHDGHPEASRMLAYHEDGSLVILDDEAWETRCAFFGFE